MSSDYIRSTVRIAEYLSAVPQLKGSVKERRMCTDFIAIFQGAQNLLKLAMLTLFVYKKPLFFKQAETYGQNCVNVSPLSLSVSKQCRISILEN